MDRWMDSSIGQASERDRWKVSQHPPRGGFESEGRCTVCTVAVMVMVTRRGAIDVYRAGRGDGFRSFDGHVFGGGDVFHTTAKDGGRSFVPLQMFLDIRSSAHCRTAAVGQDNALLALLGALPSCRCTAAVFRAHAAPCACVPHGTVRWKTRS